MKKILILLFFLSAVLSAQNITIKVNGLKNRQASLYFWGLEKTNFIISITSDNNGLFKIPGKNLHNGFYRLVLNNNIWLNFINDGQGIKIETDKNNLFKNLLVIKSDANRSYYKFLHLTSAYKKAQKKLQEAAQKHHRKDKDLEHIKKEFTDVYNNYWAYVNKFSKSDDESLISRYIRSAHEPKIKYPPS